MENTKENFQRFVAQYWGQKVGRTQWATNIQVNKSCILNITKLTLTPLDKISEEHSAILGGLIGADHSVRSLNCYRLGFSIMEKAISFLQSKGYALPFNGIAVETMVDWGWIELA